jgi:hypothetical protein
VVCSVRAGFAGLPPAPQRQLRVCVRRHKKCLCECWLYVLLSCGVCDSHFRLCCLCVVLHNLWASLLAFALAPVCDVQHAQINRFYDSQLTCLPWHFAGQLCWLCRNNSSGLSKSFTGLVAVLVVGR